MNKPVTVKRPLTLDEVVEQQHEEDERDRDVAERNIAGIKRLMGNHTSHLQLSKPALH